MLGTVTDTGHGEYAVRFERRLAHPPAKVWRALTETRQLQSWFVEILDYERSHLDFTTGARLAYVPRAGLDLPTGGGEVVRAEEPRLLEYTWDDEVLRWELEPDGDTGCLLVFTNTIADRAAAVYVAPGWHVGIDKLAALLDGREPDEVDEASLRERYERALD